MRVDLPSGTVTFLFTDVEGSTRLLGELGEEGYAEALASHREVIRSACSEQHGVEVDTQGDAFFFAFPSAPGALAAASDLTEGLRAGPISVRVGLHTGTPLLTEEGYVGHDLHRAARIAASGHGGQVLVSASTASLLDASNSLLQAAPLRDLGEHRLKDIEGAVSIFQLGDGQFPPLKTISNTNLPRPASSFVGRDEELREVLSRIGAGARLVTLTGPGGTGKTRLALEAAMSLVSEYKAGVFWVGLASLRDPALVTESISQTLGTKVGLAEHIGERELLLLLDNLEQVIEAAPELSSLVSACPNLTLLVTSRELLRVSGEVEYSVPPLAEAEAVTLFCERAQLEPSEEIAELCARLDSLPLAVELAAARTKALSPGQILERLSGRLDLLKGGRDADPRQQTLRATIEWSYDLLSDDEQRLFARLSVFAGGCTVEAAEAVCDADLDTLQSLVEKSLLRFSDERYWMLETIREFAGGRLEEVGEAGAICQRQADHMVSLCTRAAEGLRRANPAALHELAIEHANLRAALHWVQQVDTPDALLDLVGKVAHFWFVRGHWSEGRRWIDLALSTRARVRTRHRARALRLGGSFAVTLGDVDAARAYLEESLSIYEELGDAREVAAALSDLGLYASEVGDFTRAASLLEQATVKAREAGAQVALAYGLGNLGDLALRQGDFETAIPAIEESLAIFRELGVQDGIAWALYNLGFCFSQVGRADDAVSAAKESVTVGYAVGGVEDLICTFILLASLVAHQGGAGAAARLVGAADRLCEHNSYVLRGAELQLHDRTIDELRSALGPDRFGVAFSEGQLMVAEEAVELALASID